MDTISMDHVIGLLKICFRNKCTCFDQLYASSLKELGKNPEKDVKDQWTAKDAVICAVRAVKNNDGHPKWRT